MIDDPDLSEEGLLAVGDTIVKEYKVPRIRQRATLTPPIPHAPPAGFGWKWVQAVHDDGYWELFDIAEKRREKARIAELYKKLYAAEKENSSAD